MKVLILAATGQISSYLIPDLLKQTDADLVLFGHNVDTRLSQYADNDRVSLVNGDLNRVNDIKKAAQGTDFAVLNLMAGETKAANTIKGLAASSCKRLVVTGGHCGPEDARGEKVINDSRLNTTYIHMPWIAEGDEKVHYRATHEDNDGAHHVSRPSVADFITKLVQDPTKYSNDDVALYGD